MHVHDNGVRVCMQETESPVNGLQVQYSTANIYIARMKDSCICIQMANR